MQRVVCVSQDVARHCIEQEGIDASKVVTIPNGIDTQAIRAIEASQLCSGQAIVPPHSPAIPLRKHCGCKVVRTRRTRQRAPCCFRGRLHPQKGVDRLVAQADGLLNELPEHHLVIMGGGPLDAQLRAQQSQLTHRDRLHLVGWQPSTLEWMRRAELLLLPANYEGMPNVVLEAMAVGLPCVTFAVDGSRELLGESGAAAEQIVAPETGQLTSSR